MLISYSSKKNDGFMQIPQSLLQFGATKVSERLKRFVNGSYSDVETQHEWWDFDICTNDMWGF